MTLFRTYERRIADLERLAGVSEERQRRVRAAYWSILPHCQLSHDPAFLAEVARRAEAAEPIVNIFEDPILGPLLQPLPPPSRRQAHHPFRPVPQA